MQSNAWKQRTWQVTHALLMRYFPHALLCLETMQIVTHQVTHEVTHALLMRYLCVTYALLMRYFKVTHGKVTHDQEKWGKYALLF